MRLFLAIEIPPAVRREVARRIAGLRDRLPRARWVDPEILHLTLLFFGQVDEAKVPALGAALRDAFARHLPMELRLAGGGTFPPRRPARVAWVGMETTEEMTEDGLAALQADATAAAVESIGFTPEDRPFHPHVTLARCEPFWPRDAAEKFAAAFPGAVGQPWLADHGVLFESKLSPKGPRYRPVELLPFAGDLGEAEA
ncbi:MAG TPA: RNA 2',3'-cyclic phosphodiesterase [Thermoanaerobaculia bacterium]|jgi:2'-5' RNA ligase|nr:RNA 2',3'-cyclic phosphodiesterase [Thermoanaerobaculia bacterium]